MNIGQLCAIFARD